MNERSWDVYPYSESSAEFRKRTVNAIEAIVATHEGQRVVIACHGGVINAYIGHHLGIREDMFFRPAHTAVNVVFAGQHGVRALQSLGDVHHLADDPDLLSYRCLARLLLLLLLPPFSRRGGARRRLR